MDPSLTPAQIVYYLREGAKVGERDSTTGAFIPKAPVQGFPESVYQLDAYGSLYLLAKDRDGHPICGLQVVTRRRDSVLVMDELEVVRGFRARQVDDFITRVSMNPGGRRISAWVRGDSLNACGTFCFDPSVITFDLEGARLQTRPDLYSRMDADTVYGIQYASFGSWFINLFSQATGAQIGGSIPLLIGTQQPAYWHPSHVQLHPNGDYALTHGAMQNLKTGTVSVFHTQPGGCDPGSDCIRTVTGDLSPDGDHYLIAELTRYFDDLGHEVNRDSRVLEFPVHVSANDEVTVGAATQTLNLPGVGVWDVFYGRHGRVAYLEVIAPGVPGCTYQMRPRANLAAQPVLSPNWPAACLDAGDLWQAGLRQPLP
jgi:hypothetical protein